MHGLGVKIVIVPGSQVQIDEQLREKGLEPVFCGAYRVTDAEALEAAMEASGRTRVDIEAKLSRGPVIPVLRRHGESEKWHEVGISVASGNFVFAKVSCQGNPGLCLAMRQPQSTRSLGPVHSVPRAT